MPLQHQASQHSKSSLFLGCVQKAMGADGTSLDQKAGTSCLCHPCQVAALGSTIKPFPFKLIHLSLPFHIYLLLPSQEQLLAAASGMPLPLQRHSRARGTQCRDPLDCFDCLKLITLQRAVMIFVNVEEHLLPEPRHASRPSCESKVFLGSRSKQL